MLVKLKNGQRIVIELKLNSADFITALSANGNARHIIQREDLDEQPPLQAGTEVGSLSSFLGRNQEQVIIAQSIFCCYNKYMNTVIESPEFIEWSAKVWDDFERMEFIDWIAENPLAGDVIPGTGSLRKVRWTRHGMGKRGGARVIYFNRLTSGEIVLLLVYAKAKFDNLRSEFLLKLKERLNEQNQDHRRP